MLTELRCSHYDWTAGASNLGVWEQMIKANPRRLALIFTNYIGGQTYYLTPRPLPFDGTYLQGAVWPLRHEVNIELFNCYHGPLVQSEWYLTLDGQDGRVGINEILIVG